MGLIKAAFGAEGRLKMLNGSDNYPDEILRRDKYEHFLQS